MEFYQTTAEFIFWHFHVFALKHYLTIVTKKRCHEIKIVTKKKRYKICPVVFWHFHVFALAHDLKIFTKKAIQNLSRCVLTFSCLCSGTRPKTCHDVTVSRKKKRYEICPNVTCCMKMSQCVADLYAIIFFIINIIIIIHLFIYSYQYITWYLIN